MPSVRIAVGVLLASSVAWAAPRTQTGEAREAFEAGREAFAHGDYEKALMEFQRAELAIPSATLLYNIGLTHEKLGHWSDAATAFESYAQEMPKPRNRDEQLFLTNLIGRIEADRARAGFTQVPSALNVPPLQPQATYQQTWTPPPAPPPAYEYHPPADLYESPSVKASKRRTGIGLTVSGIALHVAGVVLMAHSIAASYVSAPGGFDGGFIWTEGRYAEVGVGIGCVVSGIALLIPGASLWGSANVR
jgi:hypothetical protein